MGKRAYIFDDADWPDEPAPPPPAPAPAPRGMGFALQPDEMGALTPLARLYCGTCQRDFEVDLDGVYSWTTLVCPDCPGNRVLKRIGWDQQVDVRGPRRVLEPKETAAYRQYRENYARELKASEKDAAREKLTEAILRGSLTPEQFQELRRILDDADTLAGRTLPTANMRAEQIYEGLRAVRVELQRQDSPTPPPKMGAVRFELQGEDAQSKASGMDYYRMAIERDRERFENIRAQMNELQRRENDVYLGKANELTSTMQPVRRGGQSFASLLKRVAARTKP